MRSIWDVLDKVNEVMTEVSMHEHSTSYTDGGTTMYYMHEQDVVSILSGLWDWIAEESPTRIQEKHHQFKMNAADEITLRQITDQLTDLKEKLMEIHDLREDDLEDTNY